jgi:hypothetical protein
MVIGTVKALIYMDPVISTKVGGKKTKEMVNANIFGRTARYILEIG